MVDHSLDSYRPLMPEPLLCLLELCLYRWLVDALNIYYKSTRTHQRNLFTLSVLSNPDDIQPVHSIKLSRRYFLQIQVLVKN